MSRKPYPIAFIAGLALLLTAGLANRAELFAQNPPPPVIPGLPTETQQQQPAQPVTPATTSAGKVTLQYPNNPVTDILDYYERLTGARIIRDSNLAGANISIEVSEPVSKEDAIKLIEAVLLLNGYVLLDTGENTLKALNAVGGVSPRSEGVTLYANPSELPAGEVVTAYFMPLSYISPEEAVPVFTGHVALHGYGSIVPVPNAQALVITENATVIRELIKLKELIDVPPAQVSTEFVQLERADAQKVADLVNGLLEARREQTGTGGQAARQNTQQQNQNEGNQNLPPGIQQAINQGGGQQTQAATPQGLTASDSQVVADTRTNRIVIVSRPLNIPYLRDLVKQFDEAVELMDPYEFALSYLSAADALPILVDLVTEDDEDAGASITEGGQGQAGRQVNRTTSTTSNSGSSTSGSSTSFEGLNQLSGFERETAPQSVIVGSTTLIADNRANSILVIGPPEARQKVAEILTRLDQRPLQVYLSTVIGQLTLTDNMTTGIDVIQKFANDGTNGVASSLLTRTGDNQIVLDPASLISSDLFPLAAGLTGYVVVDEVLDIFVSLLASTNDFEVLGRPTVFTQNNERATILSGARVAVPTQTLTDLNNQTSAAVTSNINFEDVVLKLEVLPLINKDREITLKIVQQNDTIIGSQTIGGNEVPTIGTQSLTTTVTVPNGSTIMLGGLISTSKTLNDAGVPFLKDIPLLGYLFRQTTDTVERQELIVMIQPTVVDTPAEMLDESLDQQMDSDLGRRATDERVFAPVRE